MDHGYASFPINHTIHMCNIYFMCDVDVYWYNGDGPACLTYLNELSRTEKCHVNMFHHLASLGGFLAVIYSMLTSIVCYYCRVCDIDGQCIFCEEDYYVTQLDIVTRFKMRCTNLCVVGLNLQFIAIPLQKTPTSTTTSMWLLSWMWYWWSVYSLWRGLLWYISWIS